MIEIRRWGERTFAAYVFVDDPLGEFVGTAQTRAAAARLGNRKLAERRENLGIATDSGA